MKGKHEMELFGSLGKNVIAGARARKLRLILSLSLLTCGPALAQTEAPSWAYPVPENTGPPAKPDSTVMKKVPGSKAHFTDAGVGDRFKVPDWFPKEHPSMPDVVANGRKPNVYACGYCHLPNGQGRPENASLAGQPAGYIIEQVTEMKEGRRKTSVQMGSIKRMFQVAGAVSPQELKTAANYFSRLPYKKWIRVVETDTVPKTAISSLNMLVTAQGGGTEPVGQRILEIPENLELTELRDPHSGFLAYVPRGTIARGKALVLSGAGALPCASCHGADFKGSGNVPALRGRSPSMIVRQLYDFRHGTHTGTAANPMKTEVANMTEADMLNIAAYLASLKP